MFQDIVEKIRRSRTYQWLFILCTSIAFYMMLAHLDVVLDVLKWALNVFTPIIIGTILTYLLYPLVKLLRDKVFGKMSNRTIAHAISVAISLLLAVVLIIGFFLMLIPQITDTVEYLIDNVGKLSAWVAEWAENNKTISDTIKETFNINLAKINWQDILNKVFTGIYDSAVGIVGISVSAGTHLIHFVIGFLIAIYMLLDIERLKNSIRRFVKSLLPREKYDRFAEVVVKSDEIFKKFFGDNVKESVIVGVACYIFCKIMDLPYPLLLAVITFFTNFIPDFGPLIGFAICSIPILIHDPLSLVWFGIFTLISQTIDGYIIQPILFGDSLGLSPFWVLIAIIIGGGLFGILGMLLAVPIAAIIQYLTQGRIDNRLREKGYTEELPPPEPQE